MKNDRALAAKGDNHISDLPMGWELNCDHTMNADPLRTDLAEIEAYSEDLEGEEPQAEAAA